MLHMDFLGGPAPRSSSAAAAAAAAAAASAEPEAPAAEVAPAPEAAAPRPPRPKAQAKRATPRNNKRRATEQGMRESKEEEDEDTTIDPYAVGGEAYQAQIAYLRKHSEGMAQEMTPEEWDEIRAAVLPPELLNFAAPLAGVPEDPAEDVPVDHDPVKED